MTTLHSVSSLPLVPDLLWLKEVRAIPTKMAQLFKPQRVEAKVLVASAPAAGVSWVALLGPLQHIPRGGQPALWGGSGVFIIGSYFP